MAENKTIEEGDLVRLGSGGPVMSVQEVGERHALCMWFDEQRQLQERRFLLTSLIKLEAPAP